MRAIAKMTRFLRPPGGWCADLRSFFFFFYLRPVAEKTGKLPARFATRQYCLERKLLLQLFGGMTVEDREWSKSQRPVRGKVSTYTGCGAGERFPLKGPGSANHFGEVVYSLTAPFLPMTSPTFSAAEMVEMNHLNHTAGRNFMQILQGRDHSSPDRGRGREKSKKPQPLGVFIREYRSSDLSKAI